jgi:hypothetical protein
MINRDRVVVLKADGPELGEIRATFTDDLIVIRNISPQIAPGDTVVRKVEGGPDELYVVIEAVYFAGTGAHYQLRVARKPTASV